MSNFDAILSSAPVNKTAAAVTSNPSKEETERSRLIAEYQNIVKAITAAKQKKCVPERVIKEWGWRQAELGLKIRSLNLPRKKKRRTSIDFWFVEVCRENMNKFEFKKYLRLASQRRAENENQVEVE